MRSLAAILCVGCATAPTWRPAPDCIWETVTRHGRHADWHYFLAKQEIPREQWYATLREDSQARADVDRSQALDGRAEVAVTAFAIGLPVTVLASILVGFKAGPVAGGLTAGAMLSFEVTAGGLFFHWAGEEDDHLHRALDAYNRDADASTCPVGPGDLSAPEKNLQGAEGAEPR
jgi:hypothetical protein